MMDAGTLTRFDAKVMPEPNSGCWLWMGCLSGRGYGQISLLGKMRLAHRIAYEHFCGPIPEGLVIDHRCRVRFCVNPQHLRVLSNKENILIGEGLGAVNAQKTHCANGHPLAGENLKYRKCGKRACRRCSAAASQRKYARRKAVSPPKRPRHLICKYGHPIQGDNISVTKTGPNAGFISCRKCKDTYGKNRKIKQVERLKAGAAA